MQSHEYNKSVMEWIFKAVRNFTDLPQRLLYAFYFLVKCLKGNSVFHQSGFPLCGFPWSSQHGFPSWGFSLYDVWVHSEYSILRCPLRHIKNVQLYVMWKNFVLKIYLYISIRTYEVYLYCSYNVHVTFMCVRIINIVFFVQNVNNIY